MPKKKLLFFLISLVFILILISVFAFSKYSNKNVNNTKQLEYLNFSFTNSLEFAADSKTEISICVYMPSMGCNQCNVENLNFLTNSFPKRTIEVYTDQPPNEIKYGENVHVNFIPNKKKEGNFFNCATPFYFLKYKELMFNKFVKSYDDQSLTNLYFDNLRILLN